MCCGTRKRPVDYFIVERDLYCFALLPYEQLVIHKKFVVSCYLPQTRPNTLAFARRLH